MGKFIPNQQAAVLNKAAQMHGVLAETGVVPADYGVSAEDVTTLGTLLASAQAAGGVRDNAVATKVSKTIAFSDGALPQLVAHIQDMGNKIRVSNATDDMVHTVGVDRRKATPTRRTAPAEAPEFTLGGVVPDAINIKFRAANSASPRARAENAIGAQVAVVDATKPVVDKEADDSPIVQVSRSPAKLDSSRMPAQVRLYARWITQRGEVSDWSLPLPVTVL
jgi:hypothetical protein